MECGEGLVPWALRSALGLTIGLGVFVGRFVGGQKVQHLWAVGLISARQTPTLKPQTKLCRASATAAAASKTTPSLTERSESRGVVLMVAMIVVADQQHQAPNTEQEEARQHCHEVSLSQYPPHHDPHPHGPLGPPCNTMQDMALGIATCLTVDTRLKTVVTGVTTRSH